MTLKQAMELGMRLGRLEVLICGLPKADVARLLKEVGAASETGKMRVMEQTLAKVEKEVNALLGERP